MISPYCGTNRISSNVNVGAKVPFGKVVLYFGGSFFHILALLLSPDLSLDSSTLSLWVLGYIASELYYQLSHQQKKHISFSLAETASSLRSPINLGLQQISLKICAKLLFPDTTVNAECPSPEAYEVDADAFVERRVQCLLVEEI